tara:strand:+ start:769 stop:951 length:183 start_codon:yes stop_codon:yes gene_type:complete
MKCNINVNKKEDNLTSLIKFYKSQLFQGTLVTNIKKEKLREFILFLESSFNKSNSRDTDV